MKKELTEIIKQADIEGSLEHSYNRLTRRYYLDGLKEEERESYSDRYKKPVYDELSSIVKDIHSDIVASGYSTDKIRDGITKIIDMTNERVTKSYDSFSISEGLIYGLVTTVLIEEAMEKTGIDTKYLESGNSEYVELMKDIKSFDRGEYTPEQLERLKTARESEMVQNLKKLYDCMSELSHTHYDGEEFGSRMRENMADTLHINHYIDMDFQYMHIDKLSESD